LNSIEDFFIETQNVEELHFNAKLDAIDKLGLE